nr:FAD-dependent oxidoreductase [Solirubrobacterales bacterium]
MRVVVVGAGVGGLACAVRLAATGHEVCVLEQGEEPGGKAGRVELVEGARTWRFDSGPSLLTMPWVVEELFSDTGTTLPELVPVEPVTRYRFADGSAVELSADLEASCVALEGWSPGAGADWRAFMLTCEAMWNASQPFLTGPPPWPPRRPAPGDPTPDPRDLLRIKPWHTLRTLARAHTADARLRMLIERFGTYAGVDPRRGPAALAVAGYVEHAFGAWHVRGGIHTIVRALTDRLLALGGELRTGTTVRGIVRGRHRHAAGVRTEAGVVEGDHVIWNGDALALARQLDGGRHEEERTLSGLALMLAVDGRTPGQVHHEIRFPTDYDRELDDLFRTRRPVRDPTLYVSTSSVSDPGEAPEDGENWFVLANAPSGVPADWEAEADRVIARLGVGDRVRARHVRSPADLERETGAVGGAIYGAAAHGRLGTL